MIETKEQVINDFRAKAQAFLDGPGLMTGIELDDAVVTLKRFVLTELRDQALGSILATMPKMIRQLDVTGLRARVDEVETALARHAGTAAAGSGTG
jgi:hypothetical protein